ncbi:MAG TPA: hypothetical protein VGE78_09530 [Agromyces sp.]
MSSIRTPVRRVFSTFRTEHAIHGTVLVSAVIAVGWNDDTDLEVLLFVLGSVGVFWLAHVYSGILAREGDREPRLRAVLTAARRSMRHTTGLIAAMVLPVLFLLLAVVGVLDEYVAYYAALWVGVAVLAVIGFTASARRGSPWYLRLVSAVVTASLGLLIIWLSALVR